MNTRTVLLTSVGLALIVATGLAAACGDENSPKPAAQQFPTARSTRTPAPTHSFHIAYTLDDAVYLAKEEMTQGPPIDSAHPVSLSYVETTVGQARNLVDPQRSLKAWEAPDDARAWFFVAYGKFIGYDRFHGTTTVFSTVWAVIPEGQPGQWNGYNNQLYDLSQLGKVVQIPGPLPTKTSRLDLTPFPFPTPSPFQSSPPARQ